MKASQSIKGLLFTTAFVVIASGTVLIQNSDPEYFAADILVSNDADFYLWYVEDTPGEQRWEIPSQVGSVASLPLGITADSSIIDPVPMDSIEFKLMGIPDYLQYDSVSTFPGFHVDAISESGVNPDTIDVTVYITPEEFEEVGSVPGGPTDNNEIGDLIAGTSEVLQINFLIADTPRIVPPFAITAFLTARDGEFTRYTVDGNPSLPGPDNPGSVEIDPILSGGVLQIFSTESYGADQIQIEFTVPVLDGSGAAGSELPSNYYIYKCDSNIPAPSSNDPNANDLSACREKNQGNISDLGEPMTAVRDDTAPQRVRIQIDSASSFSKGAYYIVRVDNVANDTAEINIPSEGIYSQMFQYLGYPTVDSVTATDVDTLLVEFSQTVCAAPTQYGAGNADNYEVISCNESVTIDECIIRNAIPGNGLTVSDSQFDGSQAVTLTTQDQDPDSWYTVRVKNVADDLCDTDTAIPELPEYYSPQFQGFGGDGGGILPVDPGELNIGLSGSVGFHLPWREKLVLRPQGGTSPYSWEVVPVDAGTFDTADPLNVIFRPNLTDVDSNPIHDERDVIIRLTDADGISSEVPVHILRRGDLGGEPPLFLDKTDVQDVNDVSAGWKR